MVLVVGFTNAQSRIRSLLIPFMGYLVYAFMVAAPTRIPNTFHRSFGASDAWLTFLQYVDVAALSQWDFSYGGPKPLAVEKKELKPYGKDTLLNRLRFGIYGASSYRCSGTPFEVPNLAPFDRKDLSYQPSKGNYLKWAVFRVVVVYLLLDGMLSFSDPAALAPLFADKNIPLLFRLRELTVEEAITRTITSASFWLVNYLTLMLFFDIPGIFCVSTGLSTVAWWRPPFNSISEAWTLRRYWGYVHGSITLLIIRLTYSEANFGTNQYASESTIQHHTSPKTSLGFLRAASPQRT